ncbi:MAG: LLM class flavin-dependent oxidoreductase [bacterium]|nr:LLM class flavin-dependent oxidoreductase [bacterium]
MGLGFGLLSAQLRPGESKDWEQAYDETLRLTVHAEEAGFSSVWTTEHHFVDDGYMPSLLVTSAAMAARTSTIEIGTGVLLAPLHDPIRVAEDAATVQLISKGRLTLGLGLGWSPVELGAFGPGKRHRGRATSEILQILPKAWSGDPFEHNGDVYQLPRLGVRPTPQRPIDVVVGGGAEPAVRRAARYAQGFFSNAPADQLIQQVRWATDEMEKIGRDPRTFRWLHYSIMYPAADFRRGWDVAGQHIWHLIWKYGDMVASASRQGSIPAAPLLTPDRRDDLKQRTVYVGPSEWIVEQLLDLRERAGVPIDFIARSYLHTLHYGAQTELMDRLAAEVSPHV